MEGFYLPIDDLPGVGVVMGEVDPMFVCAAALPLLLKILGWMKGRGGARPLPEAAGARGGRQRRKIWLRYILILTALIGVGVGIGVGVVVKGVATIMPSLLMLYVGARCSGTRPRFSRDLFISVLLMLVLIFMCSIPVDHSDVLISTYPEADTARTIPDAVSQAHDGGTIRLLPGIYNGTSHLKKSVIFTGIGTTPTSVTVDGDLYVTADVKIHKVHVTGDIIVGSSFLGGSMSEVVVDGDVVYVGQHPFMSFTIHRGCSVKGEFVGDDVVKEGVAGGLEKKHEKEIQIHTTQWVKTIVMVLKWVDTSAHWMVVLTGWAKVFWVEYGHAAFTSTLHHAGGVTSVVMSYVSSFSSILFVKFSSLTCGAVGVDALCPQDPDPTLHYLGSLLYEYVTFFLMWLLTLLFNFATETLPMVLFKVAGVYFSVSQYTQLGLHVACLVVTVFLLYSGDVGELLNVNKMRFLLSVSSHLHKFIPVGVEYLFSFFITFSSWTVLPFLLPFVDHYVTLCVVHVFLPLQSISTLLRRVESGKHKESYGWWVALFCARSLVVLYPAQAVVLLAGFYMVFRNKEGGKGEKKLKEQ